MTANQAVPIAGTQYAADQAKIAAFEDMRMATRKHLKALDRLQAIGSPNVSDWQYIISQSVSGLRTALERADTL